MSKKKETTEQTAATSVDIFSTDVDVDKLQRRSIPQIIKPETCPVGKAITGEIVDAMPSPTTSVKGNLLLIKHENGSEFMLPVMGTIRTALVGTKTEDEVLPALKKEIGNKIVCRRVASNSTGARSKAVFEVFTSK